MKDQIRRVLKAIEAAREDGLAISVTGMDEFDIADFSTELSDAQQLLALGVESPTLKKEIFKKLALKYLERFAAGREGSDCGGDRRGMRWQQETDRWRKRPGTFGSVVQAVIQEFVKAEQSKAEPATRRSWGRSGSGGRRWSSG